MHRKIAFASVVALLSSAVFAKPPSADESKRQSQVLDQLKASIAAEPSDTAKIDIVQKVLSVDTDIDFRRQILEIASSLHGPACEHFFIKELRSEEDAGLRSEAATILGKVGSAECLGVLAEVAANDRVTDEMVGCMCGKSTARRASIFAIAQLAERFPKISNGAAAALRALPSADDPNIEETARQSLSDARTQALYQVTHDESLLQPFFDRLKSNDPKIRADGIIAFRFLKLSKAPSEVVEALKDADPSVQGWGALVLGEIGDPTSVEPLMLMAARSESDLAVRVNAIAALGRMRASAAADLAEKLLSDPDERIVANAAVALYRITGKKVRQFPEGYNAD